MTRKEMEKILREKGFHFDALSKSKGKFKVFKGFFYTHGYDEGKYKTKLIECLGSDKVHNVESHYQWKAFRGGDSVQKGSHWAVSFQYAD